MSRQGSAGLRQIELVYRVINDCMQRGGTRNPKHLPEIAAA